MILARTLYYFEWLWIQRLANGLGSLKANSSIAIQAILIACFVSYF